MLWMLTSAFIRFELVQARLAKSIGMSVARFKFLSEVFFMLTTNIDLNSRALGMNAAHVARRAEAEARFGAVLVGSNQAIALHTVALTHIKSIRVRCCSLLGVTDSFNGI